MAIHFNQSTVAPVALADGVVRQPLLNKQRVPGILFELYRVTVQPGGHMMLAIAPHELGWFQMIAGAATICTVGRKLSVTTDHIGLLPPGFEGSLASDTGATLLLASVPNAERLDPIIISNPPPFRAMDWQDEPLLQSEHDARKRIYIVTPKMFGTRAIRGEMIIYPPGTECPVHHHKGGAHFMFFLSGRGTCYAGADQVMPVQPGDVVFYHDLRTALCEGWRRWRLGLLGVFRAECGCDSVGRRFEGVYVESNRAELSRHKAVQSHREARPQPTCRCLKKRAYGKKVLIRTPRKEPGKIILLF